MKKSIFLFFAILLVALSACEKNEKINIDNDFREKINNLTVIENKSPGESRIIANISGNEETKNDSDYLLCNQIENIQTKNSCLYETGIKLKINTVCEKITDLTIRDKCYSKIGYIEPKKPSLQKITFSDTGKSLCTENGVPVLKAYGLSTCSHCKWIEPIFIGVAKEYEKSGLIKAYFWEIDTKDNLMTKEIESEIPKSDVDFYRTNNQKQMVPYFNFGCVYERIGNGGYESEKDSKGEEAEFRYLIDKLIVNLIKN